MAELEFVEECDNCSHPIFIRHAKCKNCGTRFASLFEVEQPAGGEYRPALRPNVPRTSSTTAQPTAAPKDDLLSRVMAIRSGQVSAQQSSLTPSKSLSASNVQGSNTEKAPSQRTFSSPKTQQDQPTSSESQAWSASNPTMQDTQKDPSEWTFSSPKTQQNQPTSSQYQYRSAPNIPAPKTQKEGFSFTLPERPFIIFKTGESDFPALKSTIGTDHLLTGVKGTDLVMPTSSLLPHPSQFGRLRGKPVYEVHNWQLAIFNGRLGYKYRTTIDKGWTICETCKSKGKNLVQDHSTECHREFWLQYLEDERPVPCPWDISVELLPDDFNYEARGLVKGQFWPQSHRGPRPTEPDYYVTLLRPLCRTTKEETEVWDLRDAANKELKNMHFNMKASNPAAFEAAPGAYSRIMDRIKQIKAELIPDKQNPVHQTGERKEEGKDRNVPPLASLVNKNENEKGSVASRIARGKPHPMEDVKKTFRIFEVDLHSWIITYYDWKKNHPVWKAQVDARLEENRSDLEGYLRLQKCTDKQLETVNKAWANVAKCTRSERTENTVEMMRGAVKHALDKFDNIVADGSLNMINGAVLMQDMLIAINGEYQMYLERFQKRYDILQQQVRRLLQDKDGGDEEGEAEGAIAAYCSVLDEYKLIIKIDEEAGNIIVPALPQL